MKKLVRNSIFLLALLPSMVMAHPGHGHEDPFGVGHYLGNPAHAIPFAVLVAAITAFSLWRLKKAMNKK